MSTQTSMQVLFFAAVLLIMLEHDNGNAVNISTQIQGPIYYLWYVNMINKTYYSDKTFQHPILSVVCCVQHDQWV